MANKERENFYKNSTLIVDHTKNSLIDLLKLHLSRQGLSFEDFINTHQHEIYHLCYNTRRCCQCTPGYMLPPHRVLYPSQLELLLDKFGAALPCHVPGRRADFCCCTAKPGLTTNVLDITLTRTLLINFCADIFWYSCLAFQSITLEDFLNQNQHHLYHLMDCTPCCQCTTGYVFPVTHALLKSHHWSLIFNNLALPCVLHRMVPSSNICCVSASSGIVTSQLENKLASIILEQCCSLRKAVNKLVQMRNSVYGHATEGSISDTDYGTYKTELESGILEIAKVCGKETEAKQLLLDLDKRSLDETLCIQYQNTMLEQLLKEKSLEQRLNEFQEKIPDQVEKSVKKVLDERSVKQETSLTEDQKRRLQKLKGLTRNQIDTHLKEKTFVKTNLQNAALQKLEQNGVVILTGIGGIGKSRNSIALLHAFSDKHESYSAISLLKICDWVDVVDIEDHLIVLLDDIFGRTNCTFNINEDTKYLDLIHSTIDKGNVKVILTMRHSIKSELSTVVEKSRLFKESNFIDLSSNSVAMNTEERWECLLNYCVKHNVFESSSWDDEEVGGKLSSEATESFFINQRQISNIVQTEPNPLIGFPEACYLYASNRKFTRQGSLFFKHPSQTLCKEIDDMQTAGETDNKIATHYALLVYILLNGDKFDPLDIRVSSIQQIKDSVYGCSRMRVTIRHIEVAVNELTGRYLKSNHNGIICFQHRTIFESVLLSYKNVDPEKVIPYLDFDFILEMACLETYVPQDAEVVFHFYKANYSLLASRLFYYLKNSYYSPEDYMRKICASRIIRYGDSCMFEELYKAFLSSRFEMYVRMSQLRHVQSEIEESSLEEDDYNPFKHRDVHFSFLRSLLRYSLSYSDNNESIQCILNLISNDRGFHLCKTKYKKCLTFAVMMACMKNNKDRLAMVWEFVQMKQIKLDRSIILSCKGNTEAMKRWSKTVIDSELLDVNVIMTRCVAEDDVPLVEFVLEEHGYHVFDLQQAFDNSCISGSINVARWLCKRFYRTYIDIKSAMIKACEYGQTEIVKFFLNEFSWEIFDLNLAMDTAVKNKKVTIVNVVLPCCAETVDISKITNVILEYDTLVQEQKTDVFKLLKYLFKHHNYSLLDMNTVLDIVVMCNDMDDIEWLYNAVDVNVFVAAWEKTKNSKLKRIKVLQLLLQHGYTDTIDLQKLIDLEIAAHNYAGIRFLLEKCDNALIDIYKILKDVWNDYIQSDFVLWIVNRFSLTDSEIKGIMQQVIASKQWHLMECLLKHFDHKKFDIHGLLKHVCCYCDDFSVVKWLLEHFDHRLFDLKLITERFIRLNNCFNVRWLLIKFEHSLLDIESMMRLACELGYRYVIFSLVQLTSRIEYNWSAIMDYALKSECVALIKICLIRSGKSDFDLISILNTACKLNAEDLVKYLLTHYDSKYFHLNMAFKAALKKSKSPNIAILKYLLRTFNSDCVDIGSAVEYACAKFHDVFFWLLETYHPAIPDLKFILKSACRNNNIEVIKWILEKHDFDSREMISIFNYACVSEQDSTIKWLLEKFDYSPFTSKSSTIDFSLCSIRNIIYFISNFELCRKDIDCIFVRLYSLMDTRVYLEFVRCLIETYNHSRLNMGLIFQHVCISGYEKMASWLLEIVDYKLLEIDIALLEATKKDRIKIVKLVFKSSKIIKFDVNAIFLKACIHGSANVMHWILNQFDSGLNLSSTIKDSLAGVDQFSLCFTVYNMESYFSCKNSKIRQAIINGGMISFKSVLITALRKYKMGFADWLLNVIDIRYTGVDVKQVVDEMLHQNSPDMDLLRKMLSSSVETKLPMTRIMNKACYSGRSDIVKWLYENFDSSEFDIKSAFIHACGSRQMTLVEWFFDTFDSTAFHIPAAIRYAFEKRSSGDIIKLLTSKLPISFVVSQIDVEFACRCHCFSMIQWIVETKNYQNIDIDTAAHILLDSYNYSNTIKLLIQSFSPTNLTSITSRACKKGQTKLALWILQNNSNCFFDLQEIFVEACSQSDKKLVQHLLDVCNCKQFITNMCLLDAFSAGNFAVVELLISNSNDMDFDTNAALLNACECGSIRLVQWLLNRYEYDRKVFDMRLAMVTTCRHGNTHIAQWLLQIFHYETFDMDMAMTEACGSSSLEFVEWLLSVYDVDMFDIETAILAACRNGRLNIAKLLLSKFVHNVLDINMVFYSACSGGNIELVEWLHKELKIETFDINSALIEACRDSRSAVVCWLTQHFEYQNVQMATLQACEFGMIDIE